MSEASEKELEQIRAEIPHLAVRPGVNIIEILVKTDLASSNTEARRLMEAGAIYVNNQSFSKAHLESADFKNGRLMLRRGKAYKDSALIELG